MFGTNKSVIGLDIGSQAIKAIEMTRFKDRLRVTGFGHLEVSSGADRAEAIQELFRRAKFQSKNVVTAVSGKSVIFRHANVTKMTQEELRSAVRFESEKYFPFDLSEMEFDCQILGDVPPSKEGGPPEMKVLLVAVKKVLVEDLGQMLIDLGLHPRVVDVDAFAIGNAFEANEAVSPTIEPGKAVALLDLGANKTSINILWNGRSDFAREIYLGGNDFTSAISHHLGMETFNAETLKCNPKDEADAEKVLKAIAPVLDELMNEVKLSFDFFEHHSDQSVDCVCLSGGGALAPYLETAIERAVEKKSRAWNPISGFEVDPHRVQRDELNALAPTLSVAVGLACRYTSKEGR